MSVSKQQTNLQCIIDGGLDTKFMKIELLYMTEPVQTLEFADITKDFNALWELNQQVQLYQTEGELEQDLAEGYLYRYLKNPQYNERLDFLMKVKAEVKHKQGLCDNSCILCNPNLNGNDSFSKFTFDIKMATPEGSA